MHKNEIDQVIDLIKIHGSFKHALELVRREKRGEIMAIKNLENALKFLAIQVQTTELLRGELEAALHDAVTKDAFDCLTNLLKYCDKAKDLLNEFQSDIIEIESDLCHYENHQEAAAQGVGMKPNPVTVKIENNTE